MNKNPAFAKLIQEGMGRRGISLRELCRGVPLDPSFFSKVLSGKRSPPGEEAVLRRLASLLELDPARVIVSAGRIPSDWQQDFLKRWEPGKQAPNPSSAVPVRPVPVFPEPYSEAMPHPLEPWKRPAALSEELL